MLIWEANRPFFAIHRQRGSCIWLSFVLEYVDDISVKEENFFICLQQNQTAWQTTLDKNRSDGIVHRSMIDRLLEMINNVLTTKSNLDFIEYVKLNKSSDAYFTYSLTEQE
jgi:hypothetical protein